jgi:ubiquinol-cytochrome c reductase cytochrome b subunit
VIVRRTVRWLDDRLGATSFTRHALTKVFPDHWSFMIGEIALYCFVILILTGTFLAFFFVPSPNEIVYRGSYAPLRGVEVSEAFNSVMRISFEVRAGLLIRQAHHWAALLFLGAIVVHLSRIFFTGAFRRPRELNWLIGVTLLLLALFNGFSGYSLPDDLLSGTGLRIAYSILLSIPLIGTWLAFLVFGGEFPAPDILSRLLILHVYLVPLLMAGLLAAHLAIVWRQKHTQFPGPGRTETNVVGSILWPTYTARSIGLLFALGALILAMGGLLQINPIWLYGPFIPEAVSSPAQPDWYVGWLEGALRIFPAWEVDLFGFRIPNPFFPGVLLPTITFALLYAWPFLEARFTGDRAEHHLLDRPRDRPVRTAIGVGGLSLYAVLLLAGSNDILARFLGVPVTGITAVLRALVFALPLVTALIAHRVMRALRDTEARSVLDLPTEHRDRTPVP